MSAKAMRAEYEKVMSNAKVMAFTQVVHRYPGVSLKDFADFAMDIGAGNVTVGEILSLPKSAREWHERLTASSKKAIAAPRAVNMRSVAGREAHDGNVLSYLKSSKRWVSSSEVSDAVGGTPDQARQSLNRLIERGSVEYKGRTQGTKYRCNG